MRATTSSSSPKRPPTTCSLPRARGSPAGAPTRPRKPSVASLPPIRISPASAAVPSPAGAAAVTAKPIAVPRRWNSPVPEREPFEDGAEKAASMASRRIASPPGASRYDTVPPTMAMRSMGTAGPGPGQGIATPKSAPPSADLSMARAGLTSVTPRMWISPISSGRRARSISSESRVAVPAPGSPSRLASRIPRSTAPGLGRIRPSISPAMASLYPVAASTLRAMSGLKSLRSTSTGASRAMAGTMTMTATRPAASLFNVVPLPGASPERPALERL